ncbi:ERF family protein [Lacticaseibacillus hulanensis]|uniref:ERF family protein n=1 Tax=Lacticaseibacillus hulanensis TaxID=2493111 RepID=UPI001F4EEE14|nr:ERF family protein [Lacticaseibacillus hulanensis]
MVETKTEKVIEPTSAKQRLVLKLVAADKMVHGVVKDGENAFQHYVFQSEGAIKDAVKPALNNNGLSVIPRYTIINQRDVQTKKGVQHVVDVQGEFEITDGIESMFGSMVASGADTLEKATAKACTTCEKYFYKQLFHITDRDQDPDGENSADNQQTAPLIDPAMVAPLEQLAQDTAQKMGADYKTLLKNAFIASQVQIKRLDLLTQDEYRRIDKTIAQMTR